MHRTVSIFKGTCFVLPLVWYKIFMNLQVTLLVMSEGDMVVNLHPTIVSMLEEAKWMRRLGLKIPNSFHTLNMADVKRTHAQLKVG